MTRSNAFKISACLLALATSACTRVPELEDQLSADLRSADYPVLVPQDQALEPLPHPGTQSEELKQQMAARSARLQNRASALNAASE